MTSHLRRNFIAGSPHKNGGILSRVTSGSEARQIGDAWSQSFWSDHRKDNAVHPHHEDFAVLKLHTCIHRTLRNANNKRF